ncbi:2-amino-3-carboxymuconate-6-semialdehyde decarboxylase [Aspergillus sclerotiicarbonarius CBS 121057]|uniref:6-methylsalicylate decarboxylase n=1 Tax=Aspergillus sclerotiicarbonarius (strain CBS 121057 / IBT 28362) TaxID=1448318 RepID=A0A319EC44_ASPSB|nr:2-amino-3-carboxymuconate-6-semialdehyde decarboxylase [Aspergillus sclerotiicarbonarius CBS 121057]
MSKIDTHHHFSLLHADTNLLDGIAVDNAGGDPSGWPTPQWSPEASLASMDKNGTQKAVLSLTAPGAVIAPDTISRRNLARQANEYVAGLRDANPDRFGFFAALPCLLDTEGALEEIRYSLDVLKAEGVTLLLAVVFIHPTHPADTNRVNPSLPQPAIDYPHETTRTAVDLLTTGTKRDFPDCKVILSHAGGTLPYLISRLTTVTKFPEATYNPYKSSPVDMVEDFKSFYFDLALSSSSAVLNLLLSLVPHDHIVYGSDFPYAHNDKIAGFRETLDEHPLDQELRDQIYSKNAQAILLLNDVPGIY